MPLVHGHGLEFEQEYIETFIRRQVGAIVAYLYRAEVASYLGAHPPGRNSVPLLVGDDAVLFDGAAASRVAVQLEKHFDALRRRTVKISQYQADLFDNAAGDGFQIFPDASHTGDCAQAQRGDVGVFRR